MKLSRIILPALVAVALAGCSTVGLYAEGSFRIEKPAEGATTVRTTKVETAAGAATTVEVSSGVSGVSPVEALLPGEEPAP